MSPITPYSEVERLSALKEQGLLSDDEFERAKQLTTEPIGNLPPSTTPKQEPLPDPEPAHESVTEPAPPSEHAPQPKKKKKSADKIIGHSGKYGTALLVGEIISVIGWLVIIVGIIGAIWSLSSNPFGAVSAIFLVFSILGLVTVASGQLIGAAVDVANNSAALLALEKAKWDRQDG